jgi:hypothetical protein
VSDSPSPLGRYDDPDGNGEAVHEIRLVGVPVRLYAAARQHHDDLLQELSMLAVATEQSGNELPPAVSELVDALGRHYGTPADRPDEPIDAALARGDCTIDLSYQVPAHVLSGAARLDALLARADDLCRAGTLLAMPRSEVLLRFSHWYLGEFRRQIDGQEPEPWTGPIQPE